MADERREAPPADALSVGELTRQIKDILEGTYPALRIYGEVIGLTRARSGHVYFTLKDDTGCADAQISVALWRQRASSVRFRLEDGLRVIVEGRLGVYEPRGTYQLIADTVRPAGQGTLLVAFERLKRKLWSEGLFAPERKRPLPALPRRVGLITSPSGAAVHDVLRSIRRRFPAWVRLLPARVQGEGAAEEIVGALEYLNGHPDAVDVVILARGGGSLEDLWTFNEEVVARAVAGSVVPTVSGVGHEVDTTLCDLAADVRAQTPTQAGELVVPDLRLLRDELLSAGDRLRDGVRDHWEDAAREVRGRGDILVRSSPRHLLEQFDSSVVTFGASLQKALYNRLREWQDHVSAASEKLHALSPLNVLSRGFAVVLDARGRIVRRSEEIEIGEDVTVLLGEGEVDVRVLARRERRASAAEASRAAVGRPDREPRDAGRSGSDDVPARR